MGGTGEKEKRLMGGEEIRRIGEGVVQKGGGRGGCVDGKGRMSKKEKGEGGLGRGMEGKENNKGGGGLRGERYRGGIRGPRNGKGGVKGAGGPVRSRRGK